MRILRIIILFLIFVFFNPLIAQVELNKLKSAYIEKFTRFIEWPEDTSSENAAVFVIGYMEHSESVEAMMQFFSNIKIHGKSVDFVFIEQYSKLKDCNLVYIPKLSDNEYDLINNYLSGHPVLTISHQKGYAEKGTHINFYVEHNKLRFEINPEAMKKSGLKVSHHLLKLARIIHSGGTRQ